MYNYVARTVHNVMIKGTSSFRDCTCTCVGTCMKSSISGTHVSDCTSGGGQIFMIKMFCNLEGGKGKTHSCD